MLKSVNKVLFKTIIFFGVLLFVGCLFSIILKEDKKKTYNMNVSESIKLSSIYDKENVNWEASNDNVTISYDSVIANNEGKSIVSALDNDGKKLMEATINVLDNNDLSVDSHSVNLKLKQTKKIAVNDNVGIADEINEDNNETEIENNMDDVNDEGLDSVVIYGGELSDSTSYSYSSSNEDIVTVDDEGNLEPVSSGNAIVTVQDGKGNQDFVHVSVENDDLDLYSTEYDLSVGDVLEIDYSLNSIVYDLDDITWTSDNTNVAVVNKNGCVSAVSTGTANIIVKVGNEIEKRVLINVLENTVLPEDLELSTYNVDIKIGDIYVINGVVYPYSANNRDISWYSSNESIVTVNNGVIKATGVGNAIITATTGNGIKKEVNINVKNKYIDVESVDIIEHVIDIKIGENKTIDYKVYPEDATDKTVKYIYDKEYLNVDKDGKVEAIKPGLTVLSIVTYNGMMDEVLFNIVEDDNISTTDETKQLDIEDEELPMSIELEKKDIEMKLEDIGKINAKVVNGKEDEELVITSSNEKVVEVLEDGSIKAISIGSAIITISVKDNEEIKTNCFVRVKEKDISVMSIALSNNYVDLVVGDNKIILASVNPSNATNRNIKWVSSNEAVAVVAGGNIIAKGAGSAVVRAVSESNPNIYADCVVNVKAKVISVSKISINKKSLKIIEGNSVKIKALLTPANATNRNIKWVSSNEKVVKVSNGSISAVGAGSAVVSAISESNPNLVVSCNVKVIKRVTNREKFINSLEKMSKQVQKDRKNGNSWRYSGTRHGSFIRARKHGRTIDCALYASYGLVDIGVLDTNSRFFKRAANKIIYDGSAKSSMQKHLSYINGNNKKASTLIKEGKLQKGDIVLWSNHQHTNIYAGNKKWYDAGRWSANGASSSAGGRFKTLGPVSISDLYNGWKVWKILRVKN